MFGIGMPELIVIFVIALLIFGPKELPKIGKTIGRAMGELRRASDELKDGIQREIDLAEREPSEAASAPETPPATVSVEATVPAAEPELEPQLELPMAEAPAPKVPEADSSSPETAFAEEPATVAAPSKPPAQSASKDTPAPAEPKHV
jgi:TatA/E family protein of Tat protein translocase